MNLKESLEKLEVFPAIKRADWKVEDGFLIKLPGSEFILKLFTHPKLNIGVHALSFEELDATDWQLVTEDDLKATTEVSNGTDA